MTTGLATIEVAATRVLLLVVELARELVAREEVEWLEFDGEEAESAALLVVLCVGKEADDSSEFDSALDGLGAEELDDRACSIAGVDDLVTTALIPPEDAEKTGVSADGSEMVLDGRDASTAELLAGLLPSRSTEAPAVAENEMECLVAEVETVLGLTSLMLVRCWLNVFSGSEVPAVDSARTAETTALT